MAIYPIIIMKRKIRRLIPFIFIVTFVIIIYLSGLTHSITLENWPEIQQPIQAFLKDHPYLVPFIFIVIYIAYATLSLPGSSILSIIAGALFPQPYSTLYVVIGATIGSSLLFFLARTSARDYFQEISGPFLTKMEKGFHRDAANYLLFLRLIPVFPFFLVNIVSAILGVPFLTFLWTTFLGIIPASFVFTQAGAGLMMILDKMDNEPFSLKTIFNTQVNIALLGLGVLALMPLVIKRWKGRNWLR